MGFVKNLDTPLLTLAPRTHFRLRDAVQGVHAFGSIGAGKSSAFATLADAYLRAGFGGLVLCAKDDVQLWLQYAKRSGRSNSVIVFDESRGFNFLSWELARQGGAKAIGSIVDCLMRILEMADAATGITANSSDSFWPQSIRQALTYCLPLIFSGHGTVSIANVIDFVTSAATKGDHYMDQAWVGTSYAARTMRKAIEAPAVPMDESERNSLLEYWIRAWPAVPEKTRGNIVISISAKLDRFRHGRLAGCFAGKTDVCPEQTFHGALIIMAMPVLKFNDDAIVAGQLFKLCWQRAVESRNSLDKRQRERPVFLWADESQYFVNSYDESFLSTCRASRACVVYLTQTLPTYYSKMGKDKTDAADGIVGKFGNQLFFSNICPRTNQWASQLLGRTLQHRATRGRSEGTNTSRGMNAGANTGGGSSSGHNISNAGSSASFGSNSSSSTSSGNSFGDNVGRGTNEGRSFSESEQMDNSVEPRFFTTGLKTGGPAHGGKVTALWVKAGGSFAAANGDNSMVVTFRQPRR